MSRTHPVIEFFRPIWKPPNCKLVVSLTGALFLAAAALRVRQLVGTPSSVLGSNVIPVSAALIAWETFLGLWLISGALPHAARRVAIGCFSVFACYTLYEALAGKADCGCFGQVRVNPWFTFILDVSVVLALTFLGKPRTQKAGPSQWAQRKWPVAAAAERLCFKE